MESGNHPKRKPEPPADEEEFDLADVTFGHQDPPSGEPGVYIVGDVVPVAHLRQIEHFEEGGVEGESVETRWRLSALDPAEFEPHDFDADDVIKAAAYGRVWIEKFFGSSDGEDQAEDIWGD